MCKSVKSVAILHIRTPKQNWMQKNVCDVRVGVAENRRKLKVNELLVLFTNSLSSILF